MKQISLTKGKSALVDDNDFERLSQHKWSYTNGYAIRIRHHKCIYMHREILNAPSNVQVDHVNLDGLDNRRANLRLATKAENMRNTKVRRDNTSGVKGVSWEKFSSKWKAQITVDGVNKNLGRFNTIDEAQKAYEKAALKYFGKFARLA